MKKLTKFEKYAIGAILMILFSAFVYWAVKVVLFIALIWFIFFQIPNWF